jgi:hypothetical protein
MPTRDEEAVALAQRHYQVETGLTHVFRITGAADVEARPKEPIKLLEVNENTVPSGILPLQFGPELSVRDHGGHSRRVSEDSKRGAEASERVADR